MRYGQRGIAKIGSVQFELDDCSNTRLFLFESDEFEGEITIGFDAWFKNGEYAGEEVSPSITVNEHETHRSSPKELVGMTFAVSDSEESIEREDTMYIFEHEPILSYSFTVLAIENGQMHIEISGTAVTDGYSRPCVTEPFSADIWLDMV